MLHDLLFGIRHLRRRKALAAVAIAMMALGIGTTTAMFTVVHGVLWRQLPYAEPGRLVTIWQTFPHWRGQPVLDGQWDRIGLSFSEYRRVAALTHRFESVAAAYWRHPARLRSEPATVEISIARGSASLLPTLGVRPVLGRWFLPGEEGAGAPQIAVLSHTTWMTRFGGDASVLGRAIVMNDRPFSVVGVLPPDFSFVSLSPFVVPEFADAIWTPIGSWPGDLTEGSQNYEVIARVRADQPLRVVRDEVAQRLRGSRSAAQRDARLVPRLHAETGAARRPLLALFGAVVILLAIACGNLSILLLGDAMSRLPEVRTRLALGASRWRITRQLFAEASVLSAGAAALGSPLAWWLTRALVAAAPFDVPRGDSLAADWRALAVAAGLASASAIVCALAPALAIVRRSDLDQPQRGVTRTSGWLEHTLVAGQVALALVLVTGLGLMYRSARGEERVGLGFDPDRLLTATINSAPQPFYDALVERVRAMPGVEGVTTTSNTPIAGGGGLWSISLDTSQKLSAGSPTAQHDEVLPNFFEQMRIPVLAGRSLDTRDVAGAPLAAVVNESMARQMWPGVSAIGKQFLAPNGGPRVVVGICADVREAGPGRPVAPTFYESVMQVRASRQTLLIRTSGDPLALAPAIRRAVAEIDAAQPAGKIEAMRAIVARALAPGRYRALLAGFFAAASVVMTLIGTFGIAVRSVTMERRELCVRLALGASHARVIAFVTARFARLALAGISAGLAAALLTTPVLTAYLHGVSPADPLTLAVSSAVLLALVTIAAWLPATGLRRVRIAEHLSR
jgi:putative ABC transport system permease protein